MYHGTLIGIRRDGRWLAVSDSNGPLVTHEFQEVGLGFVTAKAHVDSLEYTQEPLGVGPSNEVPLGVLFDGKVGWTRPVTVYDSAAYKRIFSSFLRRHGIHSRPQLDQVVSADLDGGGT